MIFFFFFFFFFFFSFFWFESFFVQENSKMIQIKLNYNNYNHFKAIFLIPWFLLPSFLSPPWISVTNFATKSPRTLPPLPLPQTLSTDTLSMPMPMPMSIWSVKKCWRICVLSCKNKCLLADLQLPGSRSPFTGLSMSSWYSTSFSLECIGLDWTWRMCCLCRIGSGRLCEESWRTFGSCLGCTWTWSALSTFRWL